MTDTACDGLFIPCKITKTSFWHVILKNFFYKLLSVIEFGAASFLAYLVWALPLSTNSAPFDTWPNWIQDIFVWQQAHSLKLLCYSVFAYLLSYVWRRNIRSPGLSKVLKKVLDDAHSLAFPMHQNESMHDHRLTLYEYKKVMFWPIGRRDWENKRWYWPFGWWGKGNKPWSGWLIPIARSGHTTQKLRTVFLADKNRGKSEGVCGKAWETGSAIKPASIGTVNDRSRKRTIEKHCKDSFGIVEMVKKRITEGFNGRESIAAIPIIIEDGEIWGVLCLDSSSTDGISDDYANEFIPVVQGIQRLLEGFR